MTEQVPVVGEISKTVLGSMVKSGEFNFPAKVRQAVLRLEKIEIRLAVSTTLMVVVMLTWGFNLGKNYFEYPSYDMLALSLLLVLGIFAGGYFYLIRGAADARDIAWHDFRTACLGLCMNEIEFLSLPPERQLKYIHGVLKQVGEDVRQTRNNFSAGDMESRVAFESAQDYMNKLYNSFYAAGLVTDQYGASAFVPARAPLDNTPPEFIM